MLISTMTAGPTEPTAEQLQSQLKYIVDELRNLYDHGIIVVTPKFPGGEFHILLIYYLLTSGSRRSCLTIHLHCSGL